MKRRGTAVLDAPERDYASGPGDAGRNGPRRAAGSVRRDLQEEFGRDFEPDYGGPGGSESFGGDWDSARREGVGRRNVGRPVVRKGFLGRLPQTLWGRIGAGAGFAVGLGVIVGGVLGVQSALLHDERFVIPTSAAIAIEGNQHVTKAQLLSIFGEDVERNIFTVPLAERRGELERLPWVEHATVMRLLPNHLRVSITERTPVAFVRQGGRIGLVDKSGVLMDMGSGTGYVSGSGEHYSFPVVTGITADEPQSTRAARMKIFARFTTELDAGGDRISDKLSEVDLASPEDVKAVIPDEAGAGGAGASGAGELLVHFGDTDFLERYRKYREHLAEWRTQYPRLASVDMRYETQAVLKMSGDGGVPAAAVSKGGEEKSAAVPAAAAAVATSAAKAPVSMPAAKSAAPAAKAVPAKALGSAPGPVGATPHDNLRTLSSGDPFDKLRAGYGAPASVPAAPVVGSTVLPKAGSTTTVVKSPAVAPVASSVSGGSVAASKVPQAKTPESKAVPSAVTLPTAAPASNGAVHHLMVAKDVPVKKVVAKKAASNKPGKKAVAKSHAAAKPSAAKQ